VPNKPARRNDPFKKIKSGSWTKWGGGRLGLIHSQSEETWFCQSCGSEQPMELPGFLLESTTPGEFVKVCANCFHTARSISYSYVEVVHIVRKTC
jgi:hypothetical protein